MKRVMLGKTPSKAMIATTVIGALILEMLPWGQWPMPDFVALVLVFWNVFQPRRIGLLLAWLLGLVMDVHSGSLLGQHALAYSLLSFGAISLHRRLLWHSIPGQAAQLLPLFLAAHLIVTLVHLFFTNTWPSWIYFASPFLTALLWMPLTRWVLSYSNKPTNPTAAIGR